MKTPEEIENKLSDIWLHKVPKDCGFSHNAFEYFGKIIYAQCQQDNNKDKELESLFGRPINEVYDIEKYENPIDAINDIASGKLKPRDNADKKYTEEDLKNAFLEDANSITFDEYLEYLKSLNKQDE